MVYVDDMLTFSKLQEKLDEMVDNFGAKFEVSESKKIEGFLSISIEDEGYLIKMHNAPMNEEMLEYFKIKDCNEVTASSPARLDLRQEGAR